MPYKPAMNILPCIVYNTFWICSSVRMHKYNNIAGRKSIVSVFNHAGKRIDNGKPPLTNANNKVNTIYVIITDMSVFFCMIKRLWYNKYLQITMNNIAMSIDAFKDRKGVLTNDGISILIAIERLIPKTVLRIVISTMHRNIAIEISILLKRNLLDLYIHLCSIWV